MNSFEIILEIRFHGGERVKKNIHQAYWQKSCFYNFVNNSRLSSVFQNIIITLNEIKRYNNIFGIRMITFEIRFLGGGNLKLH